MTGGRSRRNALQRAYDWARTRKNARLWEFAFFGVPGLALIALAYGLYASGHLSDPIALLMGLIGIVVTGFGTLPPLEKPAGTQPAHPKSRRARK